MRPLAKLLWTLVTMTTAIAGVGFYLRLSVCLSVYAHDISKTDAARLPNSYLTYKCSTTTSGNHLFWGQKIKRSKVKVTSHKNIVGVGLRTLVSVCFFLMNSAWLLHECSPGTGVSVMVGGVFAIAGGVAALSVVASAPVTVPALTIVGAVAAVTGGVIASSGGAAATAVGATFCSSDDIQHCRPSPSSHPGRSRGTKVRENLDAEIRDDAAYPSPSTHQSQTTVTAAGLDNTSYKSPLNITS